MQLGLLAITAIILIILISHLALRLQKFQKLAYTDSLTTLPNRAALSVQLQQAVANAAKTSRLTAVIFFDLDNFKTINDRLGHSLGDLLLAQTAARLAEGIRKGDTIARFGGDEFVVIANNLRHPGDVLLVYRRLAQLLEIPFKIGAHEITVAASAGIALSKNGAVSPAKLIHNADQALYRAKAAGRGVMRMFNRPLQS